MLERESPAQAAKTAGGPQTKAISGFYNWGTNFAIASINPFLCIVLHNRSDIIQCIAQPHQCTETFGPCHLHICGCMMHD